MSSWDSYYVVLISAVLSLMLPALLALISYICFPKKKVSVEPPERVAQAVQTICGQRVNIRFFLAANTAVVLITLVLVLIPCVTTLQAESRDHLHTGLISIVTISGFAALGLLYSIRKGDMGWLSSLKRMESQRDEGNLNSNFRKSE